MSQIGSYDNLPERKCGYAGYALYIGNQCMDWASPDFVDT